MKTIINVTTLLLHFYAFVELCISSVPKPKKEASSQEPPNGMVLIPEGDFYDG
jgi:hypothetical protein